jgi:hypothetical protein
MINAAGEATALSYWPDPMLKQQTDALSGVTSHFYGKTSRRAGLLSAEGRITTTTWQGDGLVEAADDAEGA